MKKIGFWLVGRAKNERKRLKNDKNRGFGGKIYRDLVKRERERWVLGFVRFRERSR